jgi:hypothetical protein
MKYKKKPVIIEALQFDGTLDSYTEICDIFDTIKTMSRSYHEECNKVTSWSIQTLEGSHVVSNGDYIIKGVKGEFYPCKPDIFELTYEKI